MARFVEDPTREQYLTEHDIDLASRLNGHKATPSPDEITRELIEEHYNQQEGEEPEWMRQQELVDANAGFGDSREKIPRW